MLVATKWHIALVLAWPFLTYHADCVFRYEDSEGEPGDDDEEDEEDEEDEDEEEDAEDEANGEPAEGMCHL